MTHYLALDGDYLYFVDGRAVMRRRKDGSGPSSVLTTPQNQVADLLVTLGSIYWIDKAKDAERVCAIAKP